MTLRRVLRFLICALVGFTFGTKAHADSWTYPFDGTAPGANQRTVGAENFAPEAVIGPTSLFSSRLNSCTNCLDSSSVPVVVFHENIVLANPIESDDARNFGSAFKLAFANPGTLTAEVRGEGPVLSTLTPEFSSTLLLLGGVFCIIIGVRGKSKQS